MRAANPEDAVFVENDLNRLQSVLLGSAQNGDAVEIILLDSVEVSPGNRKSPTLDFQARVFRSLGVLRSFESVSGLKELRTVNPMSSNKILKRKSNIPGVDVEFSNNLPRIRLIIKKPELFLENETSSSPVL